MNFFLAIGIVLSLGACSSENKPETPDASTDVTITQVDALRKVFLEDTYISEDNSVWSYAKGECAAFQFVLQCESEVEGLTVTTSGLKSGSETISPFRIAFEQYVTAGLHLTPASSVAMFPASDKYPDCLKEVATTKVAAGANQPVWVNFRIPKDAPAGDYEATVTFSGKAGGKSFSIDKKVGAKVCGVTMDEQQLYVTNWFTNSYLTLLKNGGSVPVFSDSYWELFTILVHSMRDAGQNVYWLNKLLDYVGCTKTGDVWSFDFTNFDKAVDIFLKEGNMKRIEGGHIAHRLGDWNSAYGVYVPDMADVQPISSKEVQTFLPQFLTALENHLKDKGWADIYMQHVGDEPCDANAASYVAVANYVKQYAPSVKILDAVHSHQLSDIVDVWCPELDYFDSGYDFYKQRKAAGDELWYYTCMAPRGEYANRFLELPLVQVRILHWINFKYGATGFLHWGYNQDWSETARNIATDGYCPGGDTYIVYPAYKKVYSSIRLETMYDGINDYTLLTMLEKKNPAKAQEIVNSVVYEMNRYNSDITSFRQTHEKLLSALEQ